MEYQEEDYLSLSGIQHYIFCRRQWALIHIEQQWQENVRTLEGKFLHERAHSTDITEKRGDIIITRGMPIFSRTLGISGVCDVVEFHATKDGVHIHGREGLYSPIPVEYKRGKPKSDESDAMQLCAQAICLEEMLLCEIGYGYLYYGEVQQRTIITFDSRLRDRVKMSFQEMHQLYERRYTPKVKMSKSCKACSLVDICVPKLCSGMSVKAYINKYIGDDMDEKAT